MILLWLESSLRSFLVWNLADKEASKQASKQARQPQAKPQQPASKRGEKRQACCGGDESTGPPPPTAIIALVHTSPQRRRPYTITKTTTTTVPTPIYSRATSLTLFNPLVLSIARLLDHSPPTAQKTPFIVQPDPPRILKRCSANHTPEPVSSAHDLIHLHGSVNNHHRQSCRARPP